MSGGYFVYRGSWIVTANLQYIGVELLGFVGLRWSDFSVFRPCRPSYLIIGIRRFSDNRIFQFVFLYLHCAKKRETSTVPNKMLSLSILSKYYQEIIERPQKYRKKKRRKSWGNCIVPSVTTNVSNTKLPKHSKARLLLY